jgi:hypothetical protein
VERISQLDSRLKFKRGNQILICVANSSTSTRHRLLTTCSSSGEPYPPTSACGFHTFFMLSAKKHNGTNVADAVKVISALDQQMVAFIEKSPFLQLATADNKGQCVS